ncbi:MAG: hypothetical protein Q9216_004026 [Gyalolechia sp. 2 TL-2023]
MDDTGFHWQNSTTSASPAAPDMQTGGDGESDDPFTKANQLICLAPGCNFLTRSEDVLNNHYSSHFGPKSALSDFHAPYPYPLDHDEIYINHLVSKMHDPREYSRLKIAASPSLFRKLLRLKGGLDSRLLDIRLQNAVIHIQGNNIFGSIDLDFQSFLLTNNTGPLPFAWLYEVLAIHDSCRCACCGPATLKDGLKRDFKNVQPSSLVRACQRHFFIEGLYRCDAPDCNHKYKRWSDLQRHTSTSHCLNAKKFPCNYPGCERGGDNGFPRKDKLKSHFDNVHHGVGIPPRQPRALMPKK